MKIDGTVSFGDFALAWLGEREEEFDGGELALNTWRSYRGTVNKLLVPLLGKLPLADVDLVALRELRKATADIPARGNQALNLARRILLEAERLKLRPAGSTPYRRIRKHSELASARPATPRAIKGICEVCDAVRAGRLDICHPNLAAMFQLIALTGARLSEIRNLEWSNVKLKEGAHGVLRLQRHKTVRRIGEKRIVLSMRARMVIDWLDPVDPENETWVIPSHCKPSQPYRDVGKPWHRVVVHAGFAKLCLRDLRSGLATNAYDNGVPLERIQEMLAHASMVTTRRYTHISAHKVGESYSLVEDAIFSSEPPEEKRGGDE